MNIPTEVELKVAYHWHCEECSRENFALPPRREFTDADKKEAFREFHHLSEEDELPDGWQEFFALFLPERVKCSWCGAEFNAIDEMMT